MRWDKGGGCLIWMVIIVVGFVGFGIGINWLSTWMKTFGVVL
jgi:hypothetical protein